jgi:hypothetical protein
MTDPTASEINPGPIDRNGPAVQRVRELRRRQSSVFPELDTSRRERASIPVENRDSIAVVWNGHGVNLRTADISVVREVAGSHRDPIARLLAKRELIRR